MQSQKALDDQVALCRAHCESEGWQIDRVLTDADLTGYSDVRPPDSSRPSATCNRTS